MKILSPQRFPMHDGQTITVLTHKNIPSKIENKRQSVKIENPRSSWTMALSRSIITQAIHTPSNTNKSIIIIWFFVAARHLDMFLQFMFGLFLSSGRTSNQVTEPGMEWYCSPLPSSPVSMATPSPCHPSAARSAAPCSHLATQTVLHLEVSLSRQGKVMTTSDGSLFYHLIYVLSHCYGFV